MDPNQTLDEILQIAKRILGREDQPTEIIAHEAIELSKRILDLDEWMEKGGFNPDRWIYGTDPEDEFPPSNRDPGREDFHSDG